MSPLAFISTNDGQINLVDMSERNEDLKETQLIILSQIANEKNEGIGLFKDTKALISRQSMAGSLNSTMQSLKSPSFAKMETCIKLNDKSTTSILCPRPPKGPYSSSYLIAGNNKGMIKHWDIERDSNKHKYYYNDYGESVKIKSSKIKNEIHVILDKLIKHDEQEDEFQQDLDIYHGHQGQINALGILYKEERSYLISCSSDSTIKIWK